MSRLLFPNRGSGALVATQLKVGFAGEEWDVSERLTFGRSGDIELDNNLYMHRLIGEFFVEDDVWWLRNLGARIYLTAVAVDGTRLELPPTSMQALASPSGVVRFNAGPTHYELDFAIAGLRSPAVDDRPTVGENTTQAAVLLTPREVDFLVTFGRSRLLGFEAEVPTYAEVATTWGVATKTVDNTMQSLRRKLRSAGLARDESLEVMMGLVVRHGLVTRVDLAWADLGGNAPRPAWQGPRFSADRATDT